VLQIRDSLAAYLPPNRGLALAGGEPISSASLKAGSISRHTMSAGDEARPARGEHVPFPAWPRSLREQKRFLQGKASAQSRDAVSRT
jgi:hypothetical protein